MGLCESEGVQTTAFGVTLSGIAFGGPVLGFGIAFNNDGTMQLYLYVGGGNGYDVSAGVEVLRGDNAMLTGTSYSGSGGGGIVLPSWEVLANIAGMGMGTV